jgi:peroxiredoxin
MQRFARTFDHPLARALVAAVMLGALAAGLLFWRSGEGNDSAGALIDLSNRPPRTTTPAADDPATGALEDRPPIIDQPAPDFALRDLDGDLVRLSDHRGNVVFVNFWASWCRPCKKELPAIQRLYEERAGDGLVVLAINWEDGAKTAAEYATALGLTVAVLDDAQGKVYNQYRLRGLPHSFFIRRDGTLAAWQIGELDERKMRERLAAAGLP